MTDEPTTQLTPEQVAKELGLTIEAEFVPWSKSRSKHNKERSLNWKVGLYCKDRLILETDYMMGIAHAPAYAAIRPNARITGRYSSAEAEALEAETEQGFATSLDNPKIRGKKIEPDAAGFLASLMRDAEALDYPSFEDWADDLGFDKDSRSGEAVYRSCLGIGLKLRAALGDEGLRALRDACKDW